MKPLAILLPGISFIVRGKSNLGIACLIMQVSLIGWIPAAIWAYSSLGEDMKKQRVEKVLKSVKAYH